MYQSKSPLTVIIPHLNAPKALASCLSGLASQRSEHCLFDVVVVDNGSTVLPDQVCAPFNFVRLLIETIPGPGPARNLGVRSTHSDLLAFIDCDCRPGSGWIRTILSYLRDHPETDVIGGEVRIDVSNANRMTAIEAYESVYGYRFRTYIEKHGYCGAGNMALRREVFLKVGGFGGLEVAEDVDWGRRARALGVRTAYVHEMWIATPARENFAELARKWDRHIAHEYRKIASYYGRLRWVAKALAVGVSPATEWVRILRSNKVHGARQRLSAFGCICRIRSYRAVRMLAVMSPARSNAMVNSWRSEGTDPMSGSR